MILLWGYNSLCEVGNVQIHVNYENKDRAVKICNEKEYNLAIFLDRQSRNRESEWQNGPVQLNK